MSACPPGSTVSPTRSAPGAVRRAELGQQTAVAVPGAAEPEVAAQQEHRGPLPVVGNLVQVGEPDVAHAPQPADLRRAGRRVDRGDVEPAPSEIEGGASGTGAEIEHGSRLDQWEQLSLPPVPRVEAPEEPLRMHRRPALSGVDLELRHRHVTPVELVEQRSSPRVLAPATTPVTRRVSHEQRRAPCKRLRNGTPALQIATIGGRAGPPAVSVCVLCQRDTHPTPGGQRCSQSA